MNTTKFVAASLIALASVATTSAFADSYGQHAQVAATAPSSVTRAQVQAELVAAQKAGTLTVVNDNNYPVITATGSPLTRAQVHADLVQAQKDGSIPVVHG